MSNRYILALFVSLLIHCFVIWYFVSVWHTSKHIYKSNAIQICMVPKPQPTVTKVSKKTIKKKTIKTKIVKKKTIQNRPKPPIKQSSKPIKQVKMAQSTMSSHIPIKRDYTVERKEYYLQIKKVIKQHKRYPPKALKRHIQGVVKVKFSLTPHGKLIDIGVISGKKIFHKSAIQAIQKSFPLSPQIDIFETNIDFEIELIYSLSSI